MSVLMTMHSLASQVPRAVLEMTRQTSAAAIAIAATDIQSRYSGAGSTSSSSSTVISTAILSSSSSVFSVYDFCTRHHEEKLRGMP